MVIQSSMKIIQEWIAESSQVGFKMYRGPTYPLMG